MKLVRLFSDQDSFHTVNFRPSGISLILGKQSNPEKKEYQKTYNGVGKSLIGLLIHFCLGSNRVDSLERAIPGWQFSLEFVIDDQVFVSSRNTSDQGKIVLNGEDFQVRKFGEALFSKIFEEKRKIKGLTFRSLISAFIRPGKQSYVRFDTLETEETEYQKLIRNGFLLGLDPEIIEQKFLLRQRHKDVSKLKSNMEKDPIFKGFFSESKNVDIELSDLQDKIRQLELDLKQYKIAQDYHQIEEKANETKRLLQEKRNRSLLLSNAIANINKSLQKKIDIQPEDLFALYEATKTKLPSLVKKEIEEVSKFQAQLLKNRQGRLSKEKRNLNRELAAIEAEVGSVNKQLDDLISYLGTYKALDELVELTNYLGDLKARARKIEDYKSMLNAYQKELNSLGVEISRSNEMSREYLQDNSDLAQRILDAFRSFSKRFYSDRPSGLTITSNDGENQTRFDIDAVIQDDASDGINEVKIFCYDLTILTMQQNHNVKFLFHDNRLFSDMDPRQRATLFKIAFEETDKANLQYIASTTEDQLETIRGMYEEKEFKRVIEDSIVLILTDESPASKLLGVQIELEHD